MNGARNLNIKSKNMGRVMRFFVGFGLFLYGIIFVTWLLVPSLISDYKINSANLEVTEVHQLEEVRCETTAYVLARCNVSVSSGIDGAENSFDYFILRNVIDDGVHLLVSSDTGAVTTNIGIKYFANRVLTFVLFLTLLLAGLIVTWKRMISNRLSNY